MIKEEWTWASDMFDGQEDGEEEGSSMYLSQPRLNESDLFDLNNRYNLDLTELPLLSTTSGGWFGVHDRYPVRKRRPNPRYRSFSS